MFEYEIHNRWLFVMENKRTRPDFNITCQIYVGEGPGIGNITQPIMFCNVFCDYFADNNKIQPNVYFGDAKQTIKSLSEICDQMGEENKLGS